MRAPRVSSLPHSTAIDHLIDAMLECYLDWREAASNARAAYRAWCAALANERRLRLGAYLSALDQEECAAAAYAGIVHEVTTRLYR